MVGISGPNITVTAEVNRLKRELRRIGEPFDGKELASAIGALMVEWISKNFEDEGTVKPWARLKASTISRRRRGSSKILQDSGTLKGSFESPRITRNTVRVGPGTNLVYAATHEYGDEERGIPARPMLPPRELAESMAKDLIKAKIEKVING